MERKCCRRLSHSKLFPQWFRVMQEKGIFNCFSCCCILVWRNFFHGKICSSSFVRVQKMILFFLGLEFAFCKIYGECSHLRRWKLQEDVKTRITTFPLETIKLSAHIYPEFLTKTHSPILNDRTETGSNGRRNSPIHKDFFLVVSFLKGKIFSTICAEIIPRSVETHFYAEMFLIKMFCYTKQKKMKP